MARSPLYTTQGPFRAEQIRLGDPYELSNGHPIYSVREPSELEAQPGEVAGQYRTGSQPAETADRAWPCRHA